MKRYYEKLYSVPPKESLQEKTATVPDMLRDPDRNTVLKYGTSNDYPGLPWWLVDEKFACQCRRHGFDPWTRKEEPTCHRATESRHHNYSACALEPRNYNYQSLVP